MLKDKIKISSPKKIKNTKGAIFKVFKEKNFNFSQIKEVYFSWIKKKNIKAWKFHKKMTLNIVVPYGRVKFVFYDEKKSFFHEIIIGENGYKKITVKPKVWFGFKGLHSPRSLILNCASLRYSKKEILRKKVNAIKYDWSN